MTRRTIFSPVTEHIPKLERHIIVRLVFEKPERHIWPRRHLPIQHHAR